jgi:formylglycine-generating enzyme required for sulfatase activity
MRAVPLPPRKSWLPLGLAILSLIVCAPSRGAGATSQIELGGGIVIELVFIEPGSFQQGSPVTEPQRGDDETPRNVTITQPFYLGKYPVTRGQFARFVAETRYRTEAESGTSGGFGWDGAKLVQRKDFTWKNPGFPQTDAHPVTIVTYADARAFLTWLSRKSGRSFSLPSEAQWEYSCRAGSTTAFPNGDDPARLGEIAWFRDNSSQGTHAVGEKVPNEWRLADMPGNVWEWCEDWYAPYASGPATDPLQRQSNLSDKPRRVLRGGSWMRDAASLRSAARYRNDPASRNADNGFRVMTLDLSARAAPPATQAVKPAPDQHHAIEGAGAPGSDRVRPVAPPAGNAPHVSTERFGNPPDHRGFGFFGMILGGGVILMIVAVIIGFIRAIASRGTISAQPGNMASTSAGPVRTRIVDDGFWIESASLPAGSVIECRYVVDGKQNQSNVTFEGHGPGQFVFTGGRPSSVSISVLPGGGPSGSRPIGGLSRGLAGGMVQSALDQTPPLPVRRNPPAY